MNFRPTNLSRPPTRGRQTAELAPARLLDVQPEVFWLPEKLRLLSGTAERHLWAVTWPAPVCRHDVLGGIIHEYQRAA
jgi:hypothetical protein